MQFQLGNLVPHRTKETIRGLAFLLTQLLVAFVRALLFNVLLDALVVLPGARIVLLGTRVVLQAIRRLVRAGA